MKLRALPLLAVLASRSLFAGDYDALVSTVRKAWPSVNTLAVVCDSQSSKAALAALSSAANGFKIMVVDVRGPQDMGKALGLLSQRKPDALVILPHDHVVGDGASAATFLIQRMATLKVPTLATTEEGVKQGAVLGIGAGTGGHLLANTKTAAVAGTQIPSGATAL